MAKINNDEGVRFWLTHAEFEIGKSKDFFLNGVQDFFKNASIEIDRDELEAIIAPAIKKYMAKFESKLKKFLSEAPGKIAKAQPAKTEREFRHWWKRIFKI
jgi:hypothetical protein